MKYRKHYLLSAITILLISLICSMAYGEIQSSQNYSMRQCTLTNAGGQSSSDNYTLSHILGQPSPITSSSSSGYRLYGGFRHSTKTLANEPDGDVAPLGNRDGIVNVGDALVALRFALGLDTPTQEDIAHGDVAPLDAQNKPNPDGVINVGDALVILRRALGLITFEEFQLEGMILFGNKVITEYTSHNVTFWFADETAGTSIDNAFTVYDNQTGKYGVSGLPNGRVAISLSIHETGEVETFPGNFRSLSDVDLSTMSDTEAASYDLNISKIMHLTKPFDNSGYASWPPPYPQHSSPLLFQWDPVTGATDYYILIEKYSDPDQAFIEYVIQPQFTKSTSIECTLVSSGDQTHYEFYVYAYNADNDMVGRYMTTYYGGSYGGDYSFKIK